MALAIHRPGGDVVISTRPVPDPPAGHAIERRRAAGSLPFPARLVFSPVPLEAPLPIASSTRGDSRAAMAFMSGSEARRAERMRKVDERDRQRQARYGSLLCSHHVPYVPFTTSAERPKGTRAAVPTREELDALTVRRRGVRKGGDYMMCRAFEPNSRQYKDCASLFRGTRVQPPVVLSLERMYGAEVAPPFGPPHRDVQPTVNEYSI